MKTFIICVFYYMNCEICNKKLEGKQKKFCSRVCHNKYGNYNHQSYVKQQERALKRKKELVDIFGGCCSICGYKNNYSALEFHHLDPNTKDNNLDSRKLSNSTWSWCLNESKKCILLCSNCHREHHNPQLKIGLVGFEPTLPVL